MKPYFWALLAMMLFVSAPACARDTDSIILLEKSGAIVTRDGTLPESPVSMVSINLRELTRESVQALQAMEHLPWIDFIGSGDSEITKETLTALQGKASLKKLSIAYAKISDEGANILGTFKSLIVLDLSSQVDMTIDGFAEILKLNNLKELTLSDRLVRDDVLEDLVVFSNLKSLTVRSVFVTDDGIASLKRLKSLSVLRIFIGPYVTETGVRQLSQFDLPELDVTYLDATDAKIMELRKFSGLKSLRLINASKVTDESVPSLSELTGLKTLDLADAKLTKAGINQLKESLPKCSIVKLNLNRN